MEPILLTMDERLLSQWPDDVAAYYRELAARRGWDEYTAHAFSQSVDYYRGLAEGAGERSYWRGPDSDGGQWFFEAVRDDGDGHRVPVRELIIEGDGSRRSRYSWRHLEDDLGGVPEGSLDDWIENLQEISVEEFEAAWATD